MFRKNEQMLLTLFLFVPLSCDIFKLYFSVLALGYAMTLAKYKCKLFVLHKLFCLLYKFVLQIGSLSHTQNKNKNEKDDSQDTSEKIHTSSDREIQVLAHSAPEPLAESKEEISKAESEDRLIPQPGDGKSCFHFQDSSNNHRLRHGTLLIGLRLLPYSRFFVFPFILKIPTICNYIHKHQMARKAELLAFSCYRES